MVRGYNHAPYVIKRVLTEGAVRSTDKRVRFVGVEAYEAAGGVVLRDLFEPDDGGWLQDPGLLNQLVSAKLVAVADAVRAEGWKWLETGLDFPYGHTTGLRRLDRTEAPLSEEEATRLAELRAEYDRLEAEWAEVDELPEPVDARFGELEAELAAFTDRPAVFEAADVAIGGAFVSVDADGTPRIERGYVLPEDEPRTAEPEESMPENGVVADDWVSATNDGFAGGEATAPSEPTEDSEEDDRPISDRLLTELTSFRTVALRAALARSPSIAFLACVHVLALKTFYGGAFSSCLELELRSTSLDTAPGLNDFGPAKTLAELQETWALGLPKEPGDLWWALLDMGEQDRAGLFAFCLSRSINAVHQPWTARARAMAHADALAGVLDLDMAGAGWAPTVDNYLGRVTKAKVLAAVAEACGDAAAERLSGLKKAEMAQAAEGLLAGTGWTPPALRTPGRAAGPADEPTDAPQEPHGPETISDDNLSSEIVVPVVLAAE